MNRPTARNSILRNAGIPIRGSGGFVFLCECGTENVVEFEDGKEVMFICEGCGKVFNGMLLAYPESGYIN